MSELQGLNPSAVYDLVVMPRNPKSKPPVPLRDVAHIRIIAGNYRS
jgi:hypothetical protein